MIQKSLNQEPEKNNLYYRDHYLRHLPTAFCPGCGHGIVLNAFVKALDKLVEQEKLDLKNFVAVSGIGCSGWITSPYLNTDTFHTTHGRTLAFATGIKLAKPSLNVFVFTGDGDGAAIGGNHLIHAARRNIRIVTILLNNRVYGMTSGQVAPTTPHEALTTTTPLGNPETPFDIAELVKAAGATYVARYTVSQPRSITRAIMEAFDNNGFSFIEILTTCPTYFGRRNPPGDAPSMIKELKLSSSRSDPQKIRIGVLQKTSRPEYTEEVYAHKKR